MNKTAIAVFILISCTCLYSQGQVTLGYHAEEKRSLQKSVKFQESTFTNNYDIVYHRILWEVDPAVSYIKGAVFSLFKATHETHNIIFDLDTTLTVDSIVSNNKPLPFKHLNNQVNITLSTLLPRGRMDSLTIYYHGTPSSSGFGSFSTSTHGKKGTPILWTLSEPYGAMEWWPCKQSLSDKIDSIDIYVKTPEKYRVGSNGKLMFEHTDNATRLTYWKHRHPIATYLVAIAVTNYESYSHYARVSDTDSVEILNFVYPESRAYAESSTPYTSDVIELFSKIFIPYPFSDEKYGHAQIGWGGGMEHQTMSFIGGFNHGLITHELSHQWFGDYVTCASWQDIWVNEGFAVFCEGLAIENLRPEKWLTWKKNEINNVIVNAPSGSVFVDDTSNVNRIFNYALTYKKGGAILHMLRHQIGDQAFFAAIQNYLTDPVTRSRFATASTVKSFFEDAADTSLTDFFNHWYYGEGYPKYSIQVLHSSPDSLVFTLSQTTTHTSVDFFKLKIPFRFSGEHDTIYKVFNHTHNGQRYKIAPGFLVENVEFDPDYTIIAPHPASITYPDEIRELLEKRIVVAPNPSKKSIWVTFPNGISINGYKLFNLSGKLLYEKNSQNFQSPIIVDVSKVRSGQFILNLETNDSVITKQVIKE